ncbi:MAG: HNH endonuclease [Oscillospiraceae bacterium]|nr:HNH endonuclease [Oscillospiraceae bacterium]
MGWGDRIDPRLRADQKKVAKIINEYVKVHGYNVIMKKSELDGLVKDIQFESKVFQHSDICYNKANEGTLKYFDSDVHIYEKVRTGYYRLLGENYPYTGEIEHAGNSRILGKWINGKLIAWEIRDQEAEGEYELIVTEEFASIESDLDEIQGEERLVITKQRINQSVFRKRLLKRYGKRCCLCGVSGGDMLIASHIKPWSVADVDERVDVNNGLLLCPNHDWLFDKGYISFDTSGKIVVSDKLSDVNQMFMNVDRNKILNMSEQTRNYMKYHSDNILM